MDVWEHSLKHAQRERKRAARPAGVARCRNRLFGARLQDIVHLQLWGLEWFLVNNSSRLLAVLVAVLSAFDLSDESISVLWAVLKGAASVRFQPLQAESAMLVHDFMHGFHAATNGDEEDAYSRNAQVASLIARVLIIGVSFHDQCLGFGLTPAIWSLGSASVASLGLASQWTMQNFSHVLLF